MSTFLLAFALLIIIVAVQVATEPVQPAKRRRAVPTGRRSVRKVATQQSVGSIRNRWERPDLQRAFGNLDSPDSGPVDGAAGD